MFSSLSKSDKKRLFSVFAILFIALCLFLHDCVSTKDDTSRDNVTGENYVYFLSVGQGDCTLIETHDGKFALIDASTADAEMKIKAFLDEKNVKELEFVLFTHPHEDHIGCGDEIVKNYKVKTVYMNKKSENTSCYKRLIDAISKSRSENGTLVKCPSFGDVFYLGDISFTVVSDGKDYLDDDSANNSSICVKMELGKSSFLFTGDAEKKVEKNILKSGADISSDVYKCAHHGSTTSNSDDFLDEIDPQYAVISCGKDNSYGHPHEKVLSALNDRGIEIYRTDFGDDIVFTFDENGVYAP